MTACGQTSQRVLDPAAWLYLQATGLPLGLFITAKFNQDLILLFCSSEDSKPSVEKGSTSAATEQLAFGQQTFCTWSAHPDLHHNSAWS